MRRGLIGWQESELSRSSLETRQQRLQEAMREQGFDAILIYANHVRSGAVNFVTGFTPYWSEVILLVPADGQCVLVTALSKRVGDWIRSTSPTTEVLHSAEAGRMIAEQLKALSAKRIGVVELDRMPVGLINEVLSVQAFELMDASSLFSEFRRKVDPAEMTLALKADVITCDAFTQMPKRPVRVGDVTEALEFAIRMRGAEECYVAIAADINADVRMARSLGKERLGDFYAVRLSVAYRGAWIRRVKTFARSGEDTVFEAVNQDIEQIAADPNPETSIIDRLGRVDFPPRVTLDKWTIEAPVGTQPLQLCASSDSEQSFDGSYGVLSLRLSSPRSPILLACPFGLEGKIGGRAG